LSPLGPPLLQTLSKWHPKELQNETKIQYKTVSKTMPRKDCKNLEKHTPPNSQKGPLAYTKPPFSLFVLAPPESSKSCQNGAENEPKPIQKHDRKNNRKTKPLKIETVAPGRAQGRPKLSCDGFQAKMAAQNQICF
jgi:hypothetical protein